MLLPTRAAAKYVWNTNFWDIDELFRRFEEALKMDVEEIRG
jgi:L-arabinose isomerase